MSEKVAFMIEGRMVDGREYATLLNDVRVATLVGFYVGDKDPTEVGTLTPLLQECIHRGSN